MPQYKIPDHLPQLIQVKGRTDGAVGLCCTKEQIDDILCTELTEQEAQELLNQWCDAENENPSVEPISGEFMIQTPIKIENVKMELGK